MGRIPQPKLYLTQSNPEEETYFIKKVVNSTSYNVGATISKKEANRLLNEGRIQIEITQK